MNNDIYKLIYCSRNRIQGNPEETAAQVNKILAAARANNGKAGVTGALLFNSSLFAQALEGPLPEVERIFEHIQRDPRHSDVTVLQGTYAEGRDFADWSMAFAGTPSEDAIPLATAFNPGEAEAPALAERVLSLLRDVVVREDEWAS